jgi:hypothetical protein
MLPLIRRSVGHAENQVIGRGIQTQLRAGKGILKVAREWGRGRLELSYSTSDIILWRF